MPSASLPPTTHSMTAPVAEPLPLAPLAPAAASALTALPGMPPPLPLLLLPPPPPLPLLLLPPPPPLLAAAMQSAYWRRQASTSPAKRGSRNTRLRAPSWRSRPLACHLRAAGQ